MSGQISNTNFIEGLVADGETLNLTIGADGEYEKPTFFVESPGEADFTVKLFLREQEIVTSGAITAAPWLRLVQFPFQNAVYPATRPVARKTLAVKGFGNRCEVTNDSGGEAMFRIWITWNQNRGGA